MLIVLTCCNQLTKIGFIVLQASRIVIPNDLREHMLNLTHEGHPKFLIIKKRFWGKECWLGIDEDIEQFCKSGLPKIFLSATPFQSSKIFAAPLCLLHLSLKKL